MAAIRLWSGLYRWMPIGATLAPMAAVLIPAQSDKPVGGPGKDTEKR